MSAKGYMFIILLALYKVLPEQVKDRLILHPPLSFPIINNAFTGLELTEFAIF